MDQVLSVLTSFPPDQSAFTNSKQYDAVIKSHIAALAKIAEPLRNAVLTEPTRVLEAVDPAVNTIGYLAVLDVIFSQNNHPHPDRAKFLDKTLDFLMKFDPYQIRYVGRHFISLLDDVATGKLFPVLVAVEILATAILRIDPAGSLFTSTHLALAKLALESGSTEPALRVIDKDITFYPNMAGGRDLRPLCDKDLGSTFYITAATSLTHPLKSTTVLEYNLLCGLIYISRRDWAKARMALERVITHPTKDKGVSLMMAEGYKKWVLVGLLSDGVAPTLPSYTATSTKTSYNALATPYNNVAKLFSTDKADELKTEIETNQKTWDDDGNTSLMKEVVGAYQEWQIMNLRRIYQQVPVSVVRKMTLSANTGNRSKSDAEVLALIQKMIESNMLKGEIEASDDGESYLQFKDDYTAMTESEFARDIAQCHQSIQELSKQYKSTNEWLSGNREYVRYVVREQKRLEKEIPDASLGFDDPIDEEDLMTGVISHG